MIHSFRCKHTQALFERGTCHPRWRSFQKVAERKLTMLEAARTLTDLKVPPNNKLETLKGDRAGRHSIRVNDQYRLCFVWTADGATEVELVDYH